MRRRTDNVERVCGDLSDGDAEESLRSLQDAVAGAVEKQHLDGLRAFINDCDFDAALLKLDAIAECLHTKWG